MTKLTKTLSWVFILTLSFNLYAQENISLKEKEIIFYSKGKKNILDFIPVIGRTTVVEEENWKLLPIGSLGVYYPKKHEKKSLKAFYQSSVLHKSKPLALSKTRSSFTIDLFIGIFNYDYGFSQNDHHQHLDLNQYTKAINVEDGMYTCSEALSLTYSQCSIDNPLIFAREYNSLPSKIECVFTISDDELIELMTNYYRNLDKIYKNQVKDLKKLLFYSTSQISRE